MRSSEAFGICLGIFISGHKAMESKTFFFLISFGGNFIAAEEIFQKKILPYDRLEVFKKLSSTYPK